jgi:CheY-like chemotaxis protein
MAEAARLATPFDSATLLSMFTCGTAGITRSSLPLGRDRVRHLVWNFAHLFVCILTFCGAHPNTENRVFDNHDTEICRQSSESCMIGTQSTRFHAAGDVVRKTVLIVDDNASLRHALCELFSRQADFDVCGVAQNGREAIEVAGRLHPDLIVLDLLMPEMNGLEAARALKRGLPTVPLILYSAIDDSLSEEVRLTGISEIVAKSDPPSLLLKKARVLVYRTAA